MSEVKILLCDDDPDLQGLLVRRLQKMGIEPDAADDGRMAKGFVDKNDYDVIVTDIYMPEATGLEVMEHAKHKDSDTQVVIITSSATLDNAIDALNHGAFGYLTKPFDHLIVFDNMVSRALEYRQLVVADRRRAEAQKRRGDMLEDEVAQRVQQLQKTQKGLLDLLGSLPDGILVVEEGGKVVLSSPVGERWLAQDKKTENQSIHVFVGQIHAEVPEPFADVTIDGVDLHLMSADFPNEGEAKRKAVIIREVEEDGAGAGSMVTETVMGIKKGLATLYEQGMGTEVVLNVASQFAVLEQLQGWQTGTGELNPEQVSPQAPENVSVPEPAGEPEPPKVVKAQAAESDPTTSIPPFTQQRERTPTGELSEPRMNTSELQNALRASVPHDQIAAEAPTGDSATATPAPEPAQEPPVSEVPATAAAPEPWDETLVSSSAKVDGAASEVIDASATDAPVTDVAPIPELPAGPSEPIEDAFESAEASAEETVPPFHIDEPFAELESSPASEFGVGLDVPTSPRSSDDVGEDPLATDVPDFQAEEMEFPRADSGTGDMPSWINGIQGITDPDLLADFEFEAEAPEPSFPAAQNGEVLEDDSMFKPRVIPEAMNSKLDTPTELPGANGDNKSVPPQHDAPITIQASQADTQMFRNVLKGLSGAHVVSGDYEKPPEDTPTTSGDTVAKTKDGLDELVAAEEGMNELRSASRETTEPEAPIDTPEAEVPLPTPEELRQVQEPKPAPEPVHAEPANWPPTLPTEDDDWDDNLDVSG